MLDTVVGASGLQKTFSDVAKLQEQPLFELLREDVATGAVFPAIRKGELHFYHAGGRLCRYAAGAFYTNHRYVIDEDPATVPSRDVRIGGKATLPKPLDEVYATMKVACRKRWAKDSGSGELQSIATAFHGWSIARADWTDSEPALLDVECRFPAAKDSKSAQDMVDLLLRLPSGQLCFVEVKRTDDPRARAEGNDPEVVEQLERYRRRLRDPDVATDVASVYARVVATLKALFGCSQPKIGPVFPNVPLLIIGNVPDPAQAAKGKEVWQRTALEKSAHWQPDQTEPIVVDGRGDAATGLRAFLLELDARLS